MTRFKPYRDGQLFATHYLFDMIGDGVPKHSHDETTAHNIVVLAGCVAIHYEDGFKTLKTGDVESISWDKPHSIVALEPGSKIINFYLNGFPREYALLPESVLVGSIECKYPNLGQT
jgi:hypothetical protein